MTHTSFGGPSVLLSLGLMLMWTAERTPSPKLWQELLLRHPQHTHAHVNEAGEVENYLQPETHTHIHTQRWRCSPCLQFLKHLLCWTLSLVLGYVSVTSDPPSLTYSSRVMKMHKLTLFHQLQMSPTCE